MQVTRQHFPGAQSIARYAKELGFVVFFAREQQITDELVLRNDHILWKLHSASNSHALTCAIPRDRNMPAPVAGRTPTHGRKGCCEAQHRCLAYELVLDSVVGNCRI